MTRGIHGMGKLIINAAVHTGFFIGLLCIISLIKSTFTLAEGMWKVTHISFGSDVSALLLLS